MNENFIGYNHVEHHCTLYIFNGIIIYIDMYINFDHYYYYLVLYIYVHDN